MLLKTRSLSSGNRSGKRQSYCKLRARPLYHMVTSFRSCAACLMVLLLLGHGASANPDDRRKAINVKADNSEYDERAGTQTLSGNVEITQGSMSIKADSITIELKNDALFRITGIGNPIRFQQMTQTNELMRGQSNQISYNTQTSEITFKGDAEFERPGQTFSGHTIEYNMLALTFKAAGNNKGRVSITLQPGKVNP